jgi:hypothetical protein
MNMARLAFYFVYFALCINGIAFGLHSIYTRRYVYKERIDYTRKYETITHLNKAAFMSSVIDIIGWSVTALIGISDILINYDSLFERFFIGLFIVAFFRIFSLGLPKHYYPEEIIVSNKEAKSKRV